MSKHATDGSNKPYGEKQITYLGKIGLDGRKN